MKNPWTRFKAYRLTRVCVLIVLIHAYLGRPIEPWMPTESELTEITGIADYMYAYPTKSAVGGYYLKVNGTVLNCHVGYLAAGGGCVFPNVWWDKRKPVHATYFWMSSRLGIRDRMLHSLSQDGRQVISPQRTFDDRVLGCKSGWEAYYQLLVFSIFLLAFGLFIERQNAKHNSKQL